MSYIYGMHYVAMEIVRERVEEAQRDQLVQQRYAKPPAVKPVRRVARLLARLRLGATP